MNFEKKKNVSRIEGSGGGQDVRGEYMLNLLKIILCCFFYFSGGFTSISVLFMILKKKLRGF
mgnify:CR=1 FL=1